MHVPLPALGLLALMATSPAYAESVEPRDTMNGDLRENGEIIPDTTVKGMIKQGVAPAPAGGKVSVEGEVTAPHSAPTQENYEVELMPSAPGTIAQ